MEQEKNQENQFPTPAFDPNEIPRIPAPNPIAQYTDLNPLVPWWKDDMYIQDILANPYPYGQHIPCYPELVPTPLPPISQKKCGGTSLIWRRVS
ncbi:hypothetical protein Hanom_Chr04g00316881 [Helianthus anomalus]